MAWGLLTVLPQPLSAEAALPTVVNFDRRFSKVGDSVVVHLRGLRAWADEHKDMANARHPSRLQLFFGGRLLREVYPDWINLTPPCQSAKPDECLQHVQFTFRRMPQNREDWLAVLGSPTRLTRDVDLGVGFAGVGPFERPSLAPITKGNAVVAAPLRFTFQILAGWRLAGFGILFCLLASLSLWLAANTTLLRDTTYEPKPPPPVPTPACYRFSLARTQMAWWYFLVLATFLFIWLVTTDRGLDDSVLVLLGISSATGLGAIAVDVQNRRGQRERLAAAQREAASQAARVADLETGVRTLGTVPPEGLSQQLQLERSRLEEIEGVVEQLTPGPAKPHLLRDWLRDILIDKTGISFHRFQIFGWTLILVFVVEVYRTLAMPTLDPTLLTLLGISGGTYLGFKFPEKPPT